MAGMEAGAPVTVDAAIYAHQPHAASAAHARRVAFSAQRSMGHMPPGSRVTPDGQARAV